MSKKLTEDQPLFSNHQSLQPAEALRGDANIQMRRALLMRIAATGFVAPAVLATLMHTPAAASVPNVNGNEGGPVFIEN